MPEKHKKSIIMRLTTGLAGAVALVFILTFIWQFMAVYKNAQFALKNKADTTIEYLRNTLGPALWDYDVNFVKIICRTILQDKSVSGLKITDEAGRVIFSTGNEDKNELFRFGEIVYEDKQGGKKNIGAVRLQLSKAIIEKQLSGFVKEALLRLFIVLATIICLTRILIRIFFKTPFQHLINRANAYEAGDYRFQSTESSFSEFARFDAVLARMGEQIQTHLSELEKNGKELEKHKHHLEDLVRARTLELTEAKEKAETANMAKSRFLANMSHELRTPLNAVLGYSQILGRDKSLDEQQKDKLNIIHESGTHLLMLINDILDLSKVESGKMRLHVSSARLRTLLDGIADIIRIKTRQKGISFTYTVSDILPSRVKADETRLRQVLLNLLGNAVKFTDAGEVAFTIDVLNSQTGESNGTCRLRFEIRDTGTGIAPEKLERIFKPFEQVGEASRRHEGTGLGLSISRQLVEMMESRFEIQSEPGRGSTFRFELECPVENPAPELPAKPMDEISGYRTEGDRRLTVLVVDDKPHNRSVLIDLLAPLGFIVAEAENGREGIAEARRVKPDLVFMDLVMPVMTGFEVIREIRQTPELKHLLIIALSASVFEEDKEISLTAGFDMFSSKPIDINELFTLMENHLPMEWIYSSADDNDRNHTDSMPCETPMDFPEGPPADEIAAFKALARMGDMTGVEERAEKLAGREPQFTAFAGRLTELAAGLEDEECSIFLDHYLREKP